MCVGLRESTSTDSSTPVCLPTLHGSDLDDVCPSVSVCSVLLSVCVPCHRTLLTCERVCPKVPVSTVLIQSLCLLFKVGFDPHPHMRVPGMPPSLTGIPGGKPYVHSTFSLLILYSV